ncbi:MAG: EcsC family protein [Actinomycetota bacterium]|nr:EcsC family protein [Actinomycetota bacterium]
MQLEQLLEPYERSVVEEVQRWVRRDPGWMERALQGVSARSRQVLSVVLDTGPGRNLVQAATDRAMSALEVAVLRDFEASMDTLVEPTDAVGRASELRRADEHAAAMRNRYVGMLGAQGALVGAASLTWARSAVALVADVALAVVITMRAGAHHLAIYGVLPSQPLALEAALELIAVATETEAALRQSKILALGQRLVERPTQDQPVGELPRVVIQQAGSRALKETVEQAVRHVLGRRLAGVVPVLGAAAGGAASGWLAAQMCEAGRQVGRAAFLARRTTLGISEVLGIEASAGAAELQA